jgi:hypothetical protein
MKQRSEEEWQLASGKEAFERYNPLNHLMQDVIIAVSDILVSKEQDWTES